MKLVASSSQCVRFTFQYNGRDESRWSGMFVIRVERKRMFEMQVGDRDCSWSGSKSQCFALGISSIQCHAAFWKKTGDVWLIWNWSLPHPNAFVSLFNTMVEMKVGDRECSWSGSKGKECSRCKSVIGTVRDPVRKANASRWEFQTFNAMLHFEKKQERCT